MNKLSSIITTLVLLKGSSKLSVDERAAVGCVVAILSDTERLGITIEVSSRLLLCYSSRSQKIAWLKLNIALYLKHQG